jgi:hypothetical protein
MVGLGLAGALKKYGGGDKVFFHFFQKTLNATAEGMSAGFRPDRPSGAEILHFP